MSSDPNHIDAARSILQRVRRTLVGIERARRHPNRREAYHICRVMEHLAAGRLEEGEQALRNAERVAPIPADIAAQLSANEVPTVEQLRIALDNLAPR